MTAIADVSYAPGALTAVAGDRCWVLIDATPDSPAVDWLWQQLGQRSRPEAILAGLLGAGFAGAAGFALLYQEDSDARRLFCRGAVTATVQGTGPAHGGIAGGSAELRRIDGSGLLTWREHAVPGTVRRISLGVPPADGALRLPATAGVLLASCVIIDLTDAVVRESVSHDPAPALVRTVGDPGQAESARYPDTVTMTAPPNIVEGTGSTSAIRPLPAPAGGPPPVAAEEYDFLWGATQARSVADAAIRAPEADGVRPPAFPVSGSFNSMSAGTAMAMSAQPSLPPVASSPPPPVAGGLIDAMPGDQARPHRTRLGQDGLPAVVEGGAVGVDRVHAAAGRVVAGHVRAVLPHVNTGGFGRGRERLAVQLPDRVVEAGDLAERIVGDPDAAVVEADMLHGEAGRTGGEPGEGRDGHSEHHGRAEPARTKQHATHPPPHLARNALADASRKGERPARQAEES
jgi:hypothetical protein